MNLTLFLNLFSYTRQEQEWPGGSSAWSGLCLCGHGLCGWVLRWRAPADAVRASQRVAESWAVGGRSLTHGSSTSSSLKGDLPKAHSASGGEVVSVKSGRLPQCLCKVPLGEKAVSKLKEEE